MEGAAENPGHVGVDCGHRVLVGEGRNRARGVATDARQGLEDLDVAWDPALVVGHHPLGQPMEVGGPPIVA